MIDETQKKVLQRIQHLLGTPYHPSVKAYITELTGHERVFAFNEIVTAENDESRLRIVFNTADGNIKSFYFG